MSAFALRSSSRYGRRRPTLEDRVIARMLARSLDRELAAGAPAHLSGAHAARLGQLATPRTRRAVANGLDRLIERADAPSSRFQRTAAPCREQVREATETMRAIAARLRSAEPLEARGIAYLRTFLSDPTGSFYTPVQADSLAVALHETIRLLDVVG
jgi:hypothetical protein